MKNSYSKKRVKQSIHTFLFTLLAGLSSSVTHAQLHDDNSFDVDVRLKTLDDGKVDVVVSNMSFHGGRNVPLARDYQTKYSIVPTVFGLLNANPHKTLYPGWVQKERVSNSPTLYFRPLGKLEYWNAETQTWGAPINGESITLFGGIPRSVLRSNDQDELDLYTNGAIWNAEGIQGPESMVVEPLSNTHVHQDFCIASADGSCVRRGTSETGTPSSGAYRIQLELTVKNYDESASEVYNDSEPYFIVFNLDMEDADFREALDALINAPQDVLLKTPASGILILK